MKIEQIEVFKIMLSKEEVIALAKLLGKQSPVTKKKFGLTDKQSELVSNIWGELANINDEF